MKKSIYLSSLLACVCAFSQATNNWHFGSAAGFANTGIWLEFGNAGGPTVRTGIPMLTEEGTSSYSDVDGSPLFYTDGVNIYNASTNTTFNTFPLGGNSSTTQSAIIVPKPGNANEWLLFTKAVNNGPAQYVTIRRTGTVFSIVEASPVALVGNALVGEGMYVLGNTKPGGAYWVVFRDVGSTGGVRAYEVTNTGAVITTPVNSTLSGPSFTNTNYVDFLGIIKTNSCQNKLAFTYYNGIADIVDFNPTTGQVVANTAKRITVNNRSYGIEFSPNDAYLYITTLENGKLFQYNVATEALVEIATLTGKEAGQLQLGQDGKIYMATKRIASPTNPPSHLGIINTPNNAAPNFMENGLLLTGVTNSSGNTGFSYRGLPTFPRFLTSSSLSVLPTDTTVCVNTNVNLSFLFGGFDASRTWSITPGTSPANWQFTSGNANSQSPVVRFNTTGTYKVRLQISDNCGFIFRDSLNVTVENPVNPTGTVACENGKLILTSTDPESGNFVWYRNSVSSSNVIGIGSPLEYVAGLNDAFKPSQICVGVGASTNTISALNRTIGQTTKPASAANGNPVVSPNFNVLADLLVLKSYKIVFWACPSDGIVNTTIRDGSNIIVFQNSTTITSCATNVEYTIPVNVSLLKGNGYTITTSGTAAQYYRYLWTGASNPNEVSLDASSFPSPYAFEYDAFRFNFQPVCATTQCYPVTCSLPLEFISFKTERRNGQLYLVWETAKEENLSHFQIKASENGSFFEPIANVAPRNNSFLNRYEFMIEKNMNSQYFMISAFDIGNEIPKNSNIIFSGQKKQPFNVRKIDKDNLLVSVEEKSDLRIIDITGRTVMQFHEVENEMVINLTGLKQGIYLILGYSNEIEHAEKIVVF